MQTIIKDFNNGVIHASTRFSYPFCGGITITKTDDKLIIDKVSNITGQDCIVYHSDLLIWLNDSLACLLDHYFNMDEGYRHLFNIQSIRTVE